MIHRERGAEREEKRRKGSAGRDCELQSLGPRCFRTGTGQKRMTETRLSSGIPLSDSFGVRVNLRDRYEKRKGNADENVKQTVRLT